MGGLRADPPLAGASGRRFPVVGQGHVTPLAAGCASAWPIWRPFASVPAHPTMAPRPTSASMARGLDEMGQSWHNQG
jgi:hypothetical protein